MSETNQSQGQTQNAPVKKSKKKMVAIIVVGIFIFFMILGLSSEDKNKTQTAQEQNQQSTQQTVITPDTKKEEKQAEPVKSTPQVTVTSVTIAKDYSENEVAADEKYKGKIIEVSGKVTSIDNGSFDNEMIVKLSDGQYDFNGPWCYMKESEKEKVLTFKKGQLVTLIGEGNSATIESPMLKNCTVK